MSAPLLQPLSRTLRRASRAALVLLALASLAAAGRAGEEGAELEAPEEVPDRPEARAAARLVEGIERELARLGASLEAGTASTRRPASGEPPLRELRLRARQLFREADRLAREQYLPGESLPSLGPVEPGWPEVEEALEAALARLRVLAAPDAKAEGAPPAATEPLPPLVRPGPSELLARLGALELAAERLLQRPPTTGDVHLEVTRCLALASSLRARWPGRRMPPQPPLEPIATNDDVHRSLCTTWEAVAELGRRSGLPSLSTPPSSEALQVRTAQVLGLAAEIADELEVLHARHGDPALLPPVAHPGNRRTVELLQRASLLQRQVEKLGQLAQSSLPPAAQEQAP